MTIFTPRPQWIVDLINELSGSGRVWGAITGTLASQTDLQAALNAKVDDSQLSAFGATLIDDTDAAAARTTLGLGSAATLSKAGVLEWSLLDTTGAAITTATVTISIASPGVVTLNGHGFAANQAIVFSTTGALPTGLTAGTVYYVSNPAANTFEVSATVGGASINTTGTQSGTHSVRKAATWVWSTNVANVDVTGLSAYSELLVIGKAVSASAATGVRQILVSTDNGATFFSTSGNYVSVALVGTESNQTSFITHGTVTSAARTIYGYIPRLKGPLQSAHLPEGQVRLFVANVLDINAIRFSDSAGNNLTAGALFVYGR